jgi:hypothetical protein
MRSFVLRIILIECFYVGGFLLEEAIEHFFLSIKVLFWCCDFIYCVVPLLFYAIFLFSTIIIDLVPYTHQCFSLSPFNNNGKWFMSLGMLPLSSCICSFS